MIQRPEEVRNENNPEVVVAGKGSVVEHITNGRTFQLISGQGRNSLWKMFAHSTYYPGTEISPGGEESLVVIANSRQRKTTIKMGGDLTRGKKRHNK